MPELDQRMKREDKWKTCSTLLSPSLLKDFEAKIRQHRQVCSSPECDQHTKSSYLRMLLNKDLYGEPKKVSNGKSEPQGDDL